jgi:hypothetical protein
MRIEPQKMLKNIDLTCFKHQFTPAQDQTKNSSVNQFFIAGTADSYAKLIPFFENQIDMANEFGSATREVFFKEPIEFREPLKVGALKFNVRDVKLQYIKFIKIKLVNAQPNSPGHFNFTVQGGQINLICTVECLAEALETCKKRQQNQSHGMAFLSGDTAEIESLALGDWLGIE